MTSSVETLNRQFAVPGAVSFHSGPSGMPMAVLSSPGGEAHLMLHGPHLTHYQPAGQSPVLWMSQKSWLEADKPMRGGVPICFPWFGVLKGVPEAPGHGIARLKDWEFVSARKLGDGSAEALLRFQPDEETKGYWPYDVVAEFTVRVGKTLSMSLQATNTDGRDITITEALHTYFSVSDVRGVKVHGLENLEYIDTVGGGQKPMRQDDKPLTFSAETDRDYLHTAATVVLEDPGLKRRISIAKSASNSTVVWNPWIDKAARMPDFGNEEWPGMLCIETANIGPDAIILKPGQSHTMQAVISVS